MTEYDIAVLKHINDPSATTSVKWGAGMAASIEYLRDRGYIRYVPVGHGYATEVTDKGKKFLGVSND